MYRELTSKGVKIPNGLLRHLMRIGMSLILLASSANLRRVVGLDKTDVVDLGKGTKQARELILGAQRRYVD